jgi:hypothetical protein
METIELHRWLLFLHHRNKSNNRLLSSIYGRISISEILLFILDESVWKDGVDKNIFRAFVRNFPRNLELLTKWVSLESAEATIDHLE